MEAEAEAEVGGVSDGAEDVGPAAGVGVGVGLWLWLGL